MIHTTIQAFKTAFKPYIFGVQLYVGDITCLNSAQVKIRNRILQYS